MTRDYTPLSQCSDFHKGSISLSQILHLSATKSLRLYIWLPQKVKLKRRLPEYTEMVSETYLGIDARNIKYIEYLANGCISETDEKAFLSKELSMDRFMFDLRGFFGKLGQSDLLPKAKEAFKTGDVPKIKAQTVTTVDAPIKFKVGQLFFWNLDYETLREAPKETKTNEIEKSDQLDPRKEKTYLQMIRAMTLALDLPQKPYKAAEVLQQIAAQHNVNLPKKLDTLAQKIEEARKLSE
ncbi:MAG: hypothetical protein CMG91_12645 [Marinobacter sp.]|nr:hypothetical protein [Marinobacter sp.]|tara:strand:- start:1098 stop:1814 length:717 start_codon:yes stop_codon:yes gene_type:complete